MFVSARVLLIVRAFQISAGWGLAAWWLPFGSTVFACKYPEKGRGLLLCMIGSGVVLAGLLATDPNFSEGFKRGYAAGRQRAEMRRGVRTAGSSEPHEVRDLAENEPVTPAATPVPPDPYAAQRSALAKHGADLLTEYQRLDAERVKLKPGGRTAVAAFNVKAAHYQNGLKALQAEQAQLAALDHPGLAAATATPGASGGSPANLNAADAEASAALLRLQTSVAVGNYAGFAASLRKCLADYRRTTVFPQITAYAQQVLRDAPPAKLSAVLQQQARAAQSEHDATTQQVQAIVNQTPKRVVPPQGSTEVYRYDYDPGAIKPDFNVADVVTGREAWKGDYVYIGTRPGIFYQSADCEFNPQTKFFYTDRNVPKKRLTDTENAEIVRLYRVLGKDETILGTLAQRLARADQTSAELLALNPQVGAK